MFEVFHKKNKEGTLSFNAISANYNLCAFGQVTFSVPYFLHISMFQ